MGRGATKPEGGACEVYPYEKVGGGGAEKVLAIVLKGGGGRETKRFWVVFTQ